MLAVARFAAEVVVFHVQRVAYLFPGVADGVLELFPGALNGTGELGPASLGVALQAVPIIVGVITLIDGQVIAVTVGRVIVVEIAAAVAEGRGEVLAERGTEAGVVVLSVEGVFHVFPTAADGILEVIPRAAAGGAPAFPIAARLGFQFFPGPIVVPALVDGQVVAVAIGRAIPVVLATGCTKRRLVVLPVAGLEVGVVGFHIHRVLDGFPAAPDGILKVIPRAAGGVLALFPGRARLGFQFVPRLIVTVTGVVGQAVAVTIGRVIEGVIAAAAIGILEVLAKARCIAGVVEVVAVLHAVAFDLVARPGGRLRVIAVPAIGTPVFRAALHVHRGVVVHDGHSLLGALVLGLQAHQDAAAAHALGIQFGLVLGHAPANQRADQTTHGRAQSRGGQHRPKAGNGQHAQPQQHAGQAADHTAGDGPGRHVVAQRCRRQVVYRVGGRVRDGGVAVATGRTGD